MGGEALHRVSLYVRFERAPVGLHASALRMRAAADQALLRLRERGVREEEIAARLEQLERGRPEASSLDGAIRSLVWLGDAEGWAWAALPVESPARVVVAEHFSLRPLLVGLRQHSRFRVLAVASNRVAAFDGDPTGLRPLALPGVPGSMEEALGAEIEGRRRLNFRSDHPVPGQRGNAPIYHGHAGADDERASDRERFHRILGTALARAWPEDEVPVVLAAEVRTASELRKHLALPSLLDEELRGSPDGMALEEIHAGARSRVRAAVEARERELALRYAEAHRAGKAIDREFDALAQAAVAGRIQRLWVDPEARVPGHLDEVGARRVAALDPEEDALDGLVSVVLRRGGDVRVPEPGGVPSGGAYCAELR